MVDAAFLANEVEGKGKLDRSWRPEGWEDGEIAYSNTHNAVLQEDAKLCGQEIWKAAAMARWTQTAVWVKAPDRH